MKSSDDMIADLYERRDQYETDKKRKQAVRRRIAIPAIVGIISNAGKSKEGENAAELDRACKNYYTMVGSGMVNSDDHGYSTQADLPPANGTTSARIAAARSATVVNACEYAGMTGLKETLQSGNAVYVYDDEGAIYPKSERPDLTTIDGQTTLGDLYQSAP